MRSKLRQLPETVTDQAVRAEARLELFAATFAPETADPEKRVCSMILYSGATVDRMDYWTGERYKLRLSLEPAAVRMDRMNSGRAPLLDNHSAWSCRDQLGALQKGWIEDAKLKATARFSNRDDVTPIWKDVQDGILCSVSVGAIIHRLQDITPDEDKVKSYLAVDWEPYEGSIAPVPADSGAGFLSAQLGLIDNKGALIERAAAPLPVDIALAAARRRDIEILTLR